MRTFAYDAVETALSYQGISPPSLRKQEQSRPLSSCVKNNDVRYVSIEIREDMLHRLIYQRGLVVEHLRGLDQQAQEKIRALLLNGLQVSD